MGTATSNMVGAVVASKVDVEAPVVEVRGGEREDAAGIHALLEITTAAGFTLPRSMEDLETTFSTFTVALVDGRVLACAALDTITPDVGEVRSVAVSPDGGGRGLGKAVVLALIERARAVGLGQLCLLTKVPGFFSRCGFVEMDPADMPADYSEMALAMRGRSTKGRIAMMRDI